MTKKSSGGSPKAAAEVSVRRVWALRQAAVREDAPQDDGQGVEVVKGGTKPPLT